MPDMRDSLRPLLKSSAWIALVALSSVTGWAVNRQVEDRGYTDLSVASERKVDLYYSGLESELARHEYLPHVLRADRDVHRVLDRTEPALVEVVNRKLELINQHARSASLSLLSTQGIVVASSRWQGAESLVGQHLGFRASFHDALHKGQGSVYAFHGPRGEPSYYYAHEIVEGGRTLGIGLLEAKLDRVESNWWPGTERALVVDERGVVILSSTSQWKYRSLRPLDAGELAHMRATEQYGANTIAQLGLTELGTLDDGAKLVRVPTPTGRGIEDHVYIARSLTMPRTGWSVMLLADTQEVRAAARAAGLSAAFGVALVGLLLAYLASRRQVARQRQAMNATLQRANEELDLRVRQRTQELEQANEALVQEIVERKRVEESLRETQGELVQASKLAALGRMAAGIAHEINQPLQALQVHCSNALRHLELSRPEGVQRNVAAVMALGERMRGISRQLKTFARKRASHAAPVPLRQAVDRALNVVASRLEEHGIEVRVDVAEDVQVLGDAGQLDQVFINLLSNAIDALAGAPAPRIALDAREQDGRVWIRLADNGPGLDEQALAHLFEPFFTTKPSGEGLGLGLAICAGIVHGFGGELTGANAEGGGALFSFSMRAVARADSLAP